MRNVFSLLARIRCHYNLSDLYSAMNQLRVKIYCNTQYTKCAEMKHQHKELPNGVTG
jgi:hypothetical protein